MPRPLVKSGLPGPGQEVFPEQAKQQARNIGLIEGAVQRWVNEKEDDGGGDTKSKWVESGEALDGRIDAIGSLSNRSRVFAESILESTTHIATIEPDAEINVADRIEVHGRMYVVLSEDVNSEQATVQLQVRELAPK